MCVTDLGTQMINISSLSSKQGLTFSPLGEFNYDIIGSDERSSGVCMEAVEAWGEGIKWRRWCGGIGKKST